MYIRQLIAVRLYNVQQSIVAMYTYTSIHIHTYCSAFLYPSHICISLSPDIGPNFTTIDTHLHSSPHTKHSTYWSRYVSRCEHCCICISIWQHMQSLHSSAYDTLPRSDAFPFPNALLQKPCQCVGAWYMACVRVTMGGLKACVCVNAARIYVD